MSFSIKDKILQLLEANSWRLKKSDFGPKIFVIGYYKTGTTSVGHALKILGYRHSTFNLFVWRNLYKQGRIDDLIQFTSKFESFDDGPWLKEDVIPVLDNAFPKSKWIYLERDEASWKSSITNWKASLGMTTDPDRAWANYSSHERFVKSYFDKRSPSEFIKLDVRDSKGFQKLALFLGKTAPYPSFPHKNKTPTS